MGTHARAANSAATTCQNSAQNSFQKTYHASDRSKPPSKFPCSARLALKVLFGLGALLGPIDFAHAVYGGNPIAGTAYEKAVLRFQPPFGGMGCTAEVIINDKTLLTAGHCAEGLSAGDALLIENPDGLETSKNVVANVVFHPKYQRGFRNSPDVHLVGTDVAVIHLHRSIGFSKIVPLPTEAQLRKLRFPLQAVLIANGASNIRGAGNLSLPVGSNLLRDGKGTLLSPPAYAIYAQAAGKGPCEGDSGGGLYAKIDGRPMIIGVLSVRNATVACGAVNNNAGVAPLAGNIGWITR